MKYSQTPNTFYLNNELGKWVLVLPAEKKVVAYAYLSQFCNDIRVAFNDKVVKFVLMSHNPQLVAKLNKKYNTINIPNDMIFVRKGQDNEGCLFLVGKHRAEALALVHCLEKFIVSNTSTQNIDCFYLNLETVDSNELVYDIEYTHDAPRNKLIEFINDELLVAENTTKYLELINNELEFARSLVV
jgi:hypothetical protein